MKHNFLFLLPLVAAMLISCGGNKGKSEDKSDDSKDTTSEVSEPGESEEESQPGESEEESQPGESEQIVPLGAPTLEVNADRDGLTWLDVDGAVSYEVKVNEEAPVAATEYKFVETAGDYAVRVRAIAEDERRNSEYSDPFNYSAVKASLGGVQYVDGQVEAVDLVGNGLDYVVGDGEWVHVDGSNFTPDGFGVYTVAPGEGWDERENKFYFGNEDYRSLVVAPEATGEYVLEDGSEDDNTELQSNYEVFKYDDGWKTSTATLVLSEENDGVSDGKCVQLKYWKHSAWFKYVKEVDIENSYDTFSCYVKGDGASTIGFFFEITEETKVGDFDFTGVYMSYRFEAASTNWFKHEISLDDEGWQVNYGGQNYPASQVLGVINGAGLKVNSLADFLPFFDTFSIRAYCAADANWSSTTAYVDEVKLMNTGSSTTHEEFIPDAKLAPEYAFRTDAMNGRIHFRTDTACDVEAYLGERVAKLRSTYTLNQNTLVIDYVDKDNSQTNFNIQLETADNGESWSLVSVIGNQSTKDLFTSFQCERMLLVDDFNSYEATGQGYDANHKKYDDLTGLRAAYFSDYYSGNNTNTSPIGGSGWSLMGSSDYLALDKTENGDFGKTGYSAKVKASGNTMRHINMNFAMTGFEGTTSTSAPAFGSFSHFSFMAKGGSSKDIKLKVYAYFRADIGPSSQQLNRSSNENITVTQGTSYGEYVVDLDNTKTYYGFSIVVTGTSGTDYFYIDNICFYNGVSPYAL